jgi:hypothetical protein
MSAIEEPGEGSYVAVKPGDGTVHVYHRRDDLARKYEVGDARWGCSTNVIRPSLTWQELTGLGEIAHVGMFMDRRTT